MFKKLVISVLIISLIGSISGQVFAKESIQVTEHSIQNILAMPKKDITFIKGGFDDLSDMEYTYTSNSKKYKAIEKTSPDLTHVDSEIYEETTTGEFELIANLMVEVNGAVVETTITPSNGEPKFVDTFIKPEPTDANTFSPELNTLGDRGDYPISSWTHYGTFNYSTKIKKYTVAAVTAVISGIVGASTMGAGAAATISSTTGLIAYIVDDQIEDIWYTDFVYYKTLLPPDPKMFRMKVAEKTVHYFYSDSNRDNLMKGSPITSEFWLDGYKKN
ncbi:hypothetical protein M5X00_19045 [Paenibacillus alvei]|uniref:Uncharacterized protein n=2 Tax=Paenibacillus TaxID=44249 RepID=A0ABT4GVL8_PAEAL|nr:MULTISPECIES: hypothetical protein [Paenibacillus]EJW19479.1 hypothetical protein PAV_1c04600 [Paenibacillus alvei DSM 29]MBG9735977.1 hypothetical protein [Paenibacillus alvei]MBG9742572.1 hypothetical protein [Paenibacillus alvei]MCY9541307.1 hypothetical protein [Paenibacillus alvei]MCY9578262.1 hypothetical protein [Paenibacillus alvei]